MLEWRVSCALKHAYRVGNAFLNQVGESSGNAQLMTWVIPYLREKPCESISPAPTKMRG